MRSAETRLLAVVFAASVAGMAPACAQTMTVHQVQQAASAVQADPDFGGSHVERKLRWKASDTPAKKDDLRPAHESSWVEGLGLWLAESGRLLMWLLGAACVALLLVGLRRWILVAGGIGTTGRVVLPSHVRDLDIRPESLPDDIASAARALWMQEQHRASLSLLYRGALSRLVHHHAVPIRAASTEGDCVALASRVLPQESGAFFERLVKAWLLLVYGAQSPDDELVIALCDRFDAQLPPAVAAPGTTA